MQRNPIEQKKIKYYKNIQYRKIKPLFLWTKCVKCGNEFRRETMYELGEPSVIFSYYYFKQGCQNCFSSMDDFKKWCEENVLIKPEEFSDPRKILL